MVSTVVARTSPEDLAVLAYQQRPVQPQGIALAIVVVAISIIVIDICVVGLRVWVRSWYLRSAGAWGMDDTLTVIGFFPYLASCAFGILASFYGLGMLEKDMENPEALTVRGLEYFAYWQFCYALAIGFVKSSICVALLRITPEKCYRIPLWIIIASAGCTSLGGLISLFTLCRPITANWNPGTGECAPRQIIATLSYMISVLAIVTDLFCAVVPWFIIRNLQMPRRSKYSILAVLALGVVASLGSAMRIPYLTAYSATKDHLHGYSYIVLWSSIESGLGLAAGSIAPLGKLFKFFRDTSTNSSESNPLQGPGLRTVGGTLLSPSGTQLDSLTPKGKGRSSIQISSNRTWHRLDDDINHMAVLQKRTIDVYIESGSMSDEHDHEKKPALP